MVNIKLRDTLPMRCTHHRKRGYRVSIRLSTGSAHDQKAAYEAGILQHLEPKSITADKGYQDTGCNHVCEKTVSEVSESSAPSVQPNPSRYSACDRAKYLHIKV